MDCYFYYFYSLFSCSLNGALESKNVFEETCALHKRMAYVFVSTTIVDPNEMAYSMSLTPGSRICHSCYSRNDYLL